MGGTDEEEGQEGMKEKKVCRWCEYFIPRASMCVEVRSGSPGGMPLKRRANEKCSHFVTWKPSDAIKSLQTDDRLRARPSLT